MKQNVIHPANRVVGQFIADQLGKQGITLRTLERETGVSRNVLQNLKKI